MRYYKSRNAAKLPFFAGPKIESLTFLLERF
jgi:hypothetical protein